jgi:hypothetical protein
MGCTRTLALLALLALAAPGCLDYHLWGDDDIGEDKPDTPGPDDGWEWDSDDVPEDSGETCTDTPIDETAEDCDDTGLHPDEALWEIGVPTSDSSGAEPTCSELAELDWAMTEEWRYTYGCFVMSPVIAPEPPASWATVFVDDSHGNLVGLDGRDGSVTLEVATGTYTDDGGTPAVGNADGVAGLELVTQAWELVIVVDVATGSHQVFGVPPEERFDDSVAWADADGDGIFDLISPKTAYTLEGARIASFEDYHADAAGFFVADTDSDGRQEMINGVGMWNLDDGSAERWPTGLFLGGNFYGLAIEADGALALLNDSGNGTSYLLRPDGTVLAAWPDHRGGLPSAGDATGDGVPELCFNAEDGTHLVDLEGRELQRWQDDEESYLSGGCSMADLDADGVYELVAISTHGLFVYDGLTGATLASRPELTTRHRDAPPLIADIDGDGSAEIVVTTDEAVVALGATSGRWARTRKVWHQLAYDITSIDDYGNLVPWPLPVWSTFNAFRAQPAMDGDKPDLAVEVAREAYEWCGETFVELQIAVRNLGSQRAAAGAALRVYSDPSGSWELVGEGTIPQAIPAQSVVEARIVLPAAELGARVMVEAAGDARDCDPINNRGFP